MGAMGQRADPDLQLANVQAATATPGDAPITLPSGQTVTLIEVINTVAGTDGLAARFRFLAPAIAPKTGSVDAETASADMDWLCQSYALPKISNIGPRPVQIVISLSDMNVRFGETHEEATQFFNSYSIKDGVCVWEMF